jgi:beta-lactamase regulating signal transducer with metallopeptidase domain
MIVLVWLSGAVVFWVRLAGGWLLATRLRSTVGPAPADWQSVLNRLKASVGVYRPIRLLVSVAVQFPTVIVWLRPVVLMPIGACTGLPAEHVEMLIIHELAHIRRHDYLVNMLQGIAEALLFYHPAVWWISGQIRHERELCCGDFVVRVTGDVLTYARALTELESSRKVYLKNGPRSRWWFTYIPDCEITRTIAIGTPARVRPGGNHESSSDSLHHRSRSLSRRKPRRRAIRRRLTI